MRRRADCVAQLQVKWVGALEAAQYALGEVLVAALAALV